MRKITITVTSDIPASETLELVKLLGVADASLNGNVITGITRNNLIGPLRTTRGIASVTAEGDNNALPTQPPPLPQTAKPSSPDLSPSPRPAPSYVPDPKRYG